MPRLAAACIAAKRHLSLGRVVANSLRQHHPDIPFFLLLADEAEGYFKPENEPYHLLPLAELTDPRLAQMRFHYTQQEFTYAATPYLLSYLLDQGYTGVVFIKQESLVLADMYGVLAQLENNSVLLTPHLLSPLSGEDRAARELNILLSGMYNGGFAAFSDAPESRRFLHWWEDRVFAHCRHAVGDGMHFEQRWLDFAPVFVEKTHIVRDPGMNVGHWNLPERQIEVHGSTVLADGALCRLFRFSGFDPEYPNAATRYSKRLHMADLGPAAEVFRRYADLLEHAGYEETKKWPYAYDRFDNGVEIPPVVRQICREEGRQFGDPFRTAPEGSYFRWLNESPDGEIPRLWRCIYRMRSDLQTAFPDPAGSDRESFLNWTIQHGAAEFGVPTALLPLPALQPA